MRYVEAPRYSPVASFTPSIFLAGGITGCPDWQSDIVSLLADTDLVIYNPRRKNFPIDDPAAAEEQINWEHYFMARSLYISFWFPCESLCPIVLYELGYWSHSDKMIFVGIHPEYKRRQDVEIQTALARSPTWYGKDRLVKIVYSLEDLVKQIKEKYASYEDD